MNRPPPITYRRKAILSLTFVCVAAAWWGCTASDMSTFTSSSSAGPDSSSSGGKGGGTASSSNASGGGAGGMDIDFDAGNDGAPPIDDAGVCSSTSAAAQQIPLDM